MTSTFVFDQELARALEFSEASYWSKFYRSGNDLKSYAATIAGAFAGAVPELDILAINRVVGLGMNGRVSPEDVDNLISFYRQAGVRRFFVPISPLVAQTDLADILQEKGIRPYNKWAKLFRPVKKPWPATGTSPELKVIRIAKERAREYAQIIFDSFDWTDERLVGWLASSVGQACYRHYLVMKEDRPIAAGAMHIHYDYASMAFAGTLPAFRGLGAQQLLLQERIEEARRLGCSYLISETAEDKPEQPVVSFRNMQKMGFEVAYLRPNWIYEE